MNALVLAEHDSTTLSAATQAAVNAALQLTPAVEVLCIGDDKLTAEQLAPAIALKAQGHAYMVAPANSFGKDVLPRVAALLDAPQISDITEIVDATTFKRPIYAGNAIETVQVNAPIVLLTIRQSAFAGKGVAAPKMTALNMETTQSKSHFISMEQTESTRPELSGARLVIAGGRGVGSAERFKALEELADKLGAAIGASRAAVDAGFAPNAYQIGQTGKNVAPDLYLAVGISGAIQHVAGMKDSKVIVAINKDENAPIFEIADYGLVADLNTALPELKTLLG